LSGWDRKFNEEKTMDTFSFGQFMREGGWGMWPVMLLGLAVVAGAVRYASHPGAPRLRFAAALWLTLLVATAHAVATDVAAVLHYLEDATRAPDSQFSRILVTGLKESLRPAALGGIFLTLAPLVVAVGFYRSGIGASGGRDV
jgi:hypothetical protein